MQVLSTVLIVSAVTVMVLAAVLGLVVHRMLRRKRADDLVWGEATAHRLTGMGHLFHANATGQVRGSLSGRTAVLARTTDGRTAAVVTLHVPLDTADGPRRPNLRLPKDGSDHRFGSRWVQVWTPDTDPAAGPPLLARALTLAQAAEAQQTAPWALFAGQRGLAFKSSRQGEPCVIEGEFGGVPVHVHLDGTHKPAARTVIVAAFPRRRRSTGPVPGLGTLESLTVDLPDLLQRYKDAEVEDGTVRLHIDGMVTDDLEERLNEAILLARAFASSASS